MKEERPVSAVQAEDMAKEPAGAQEEVSVSPDSNGRNSSEASVQVSQDVLGSFTTPEITEISPETELETETRRELGRVIHSMLVVGLAVSTIIIIIGLLLDALLHRQLPTGVSSYRQILDGLERGSPSSFLDLGILVLIATPVLRVLGSLVEFIGKRDWRYVTVTSLVLLILAVSIMVGSR